MMHILRVHMALLNTPPVQMNAQVQALIHSHIMQHLQMKADILGEQQMPPRSYATVQQYTASSTGITTEAQNLSLTSRRYIGTILITYTC
jgi:hypothetical protein